jgi:hypothetical protein
VIETSLRVPHTQGFQELGIRRVGFDLATVVADRLKKFLDFGQETDVENRSGKLDMSEMTGTLFLAFLTSLTIPLPIDRPKARVIQTLCARPLSLFILLCCDPVSNHQSPIIGKEGQTIVSGYSTWTTLIRLISSGENRPNWISLMVRKGALE